MTANATRATRSRSVSLPLRAARVAVVPDLVVVAIAVAFAVAVSRAPVGSGDYGQWLMVSRLYLGQDVPPYRELEGVAPLVPALLAMIRVFVDDPVAALGVLRIVLLTGLILGFYVAGNALFRSRSSALMIAVVPVLMTYQFLELFAFGGVLQAASMVFLLLAIAAISRVSRGGKHERRWWITASACTALAMLSHTASVVVIVPAVAAAGVVVLAGGGIRLWREWPRRVVPALAIGALPSLYWIVVLGPANRAYATNPASLAYRGPDRLFDPFVDPGLTMALLFIGAVSLGFGVGRCLRRRAVDAHALVAVWAAATWLVPIGAIVSGAATDYPRFTPLLLAPLAVAAGGGIAEFGRFIQHRLVPVDLHWLNPAVVIAAALIIVLGPRQLDTFHDRAAGYALDDAHGLADAAAWIDENLPEGQSVLASSGREGKWIEGLTGKEAVFAVPIRYSFRSVEWDRSLAAAALLRSTTSVVNGAWLGMFTSASEGEREAVPSELLLAMNHDGEYLDLLRFPDTEAYITSNGEVLARLANLEPVSVERLETEDRVTVRTVWTGVRQGVTVSWTREVSLDRGSTSLLISDKATAGVPIDQVVVNLRTDGPYPVSSISTDVSEARLRFFEAGRRAPVLDVAAPPGVDLSQSGKGVVASAPASETLTLKLTAQTAGEPVTGLRLLYPPQVLEDYGIGAALIGLGPAGPERLERLRALGFSREIEAGAYILMIRENAVGRSEPPAPANTQAAPP